MWRLGTFRWWLLRRVLPKRRPSPPLATARTKTAKAARWKQVEVAETESENTVSYYRSFVMPNLRFASGSTHKTFHSVHTIMRPSDFVQIASFLSMLIGVGLRFAQAKLNRKYVALESDVMSCASVAAVAISAPKSARFLAPFEPSITRAMLPGCSVSK